MIPALPALKVGQRWKENESGRIIVIMDANKVRWRYEDEPDSGWYSTCNIYDFYLWDRFTFIGWQS